MLRPTPTATASGDCSAWIRGPSIASDDCFVREEQRDLTCCHRGKRHSEARAAARAEAAVAMLEAAATPGCLAIAERPGSAGRPDSEQAQSRVCYGQRAVPRGRCGQTRSRGCRLAHALAMSSSSLPAQTRCFSYRPLFRQVSSDTLCALPHSMREQFSHWPSPSLSTSGETLTIEESVNLEGENGERRNVGDEHEWSCARG